MVIGIDIGSTTTKVAAINLNNDIIKIKTKAIDAITSATGAFGKRITNKSDLDIIMQYASKGNINNVDLNIGDIAETNLCFLNKEFTASNFGKILDIAAKEDIAIGIINLTYQVI